MKTLMIRKSKYGEGLFFAALREDDKTLWVGTEGTKKEVVNEILKADIQTKIQFA